ncbi:hypothetical protein HZS_7072 [Henneguya salminicola]|nr:hypothetical protein HZS_7072 [Henneguya salminicola]
MVRSELTELYGPLYMNLLTQDLKVQSRAFTAVVSQIRLLGSYTRMARIREREQQFLIGDNRKIITENCPAVESELQVLEKSIARLKVDYGEATFPFLRRYDGPFEVLGVMENRLLVRIRNKAEWANIKRIKPLEIERGEDVVPSPLCGSEAKKNNNNVID